MCVLMNIFKTYNRAVRYTCTWVQGMGPSLCAMRPRLLTATLEGVSYYITYLLTILTKRFYVNHSCAQFSSRFSMFNV